jgi:hypothetical protein
MIGFRGGIGSGTALRRRRHRCACDYGVAKCARQVWQLDPTGDVSGKERCGSLVPRGGPEGAAGSTDGGAASAGGSNGVCTSCRNSNSSRGKSDKMVLTTSCRLLSLILRAEATPRRTRSTHEQQEENQAVARMVYSRETECT